MTKTLTIALTVASLAASAAPYANANAAGLQPAVAHNGDAQLQLAQFRGGCFAGERSGDCRERRRWEHGNGHHHYVWRDGRYVDDSGAAIAGGILGFALGAAIAGSSSDHDYYVAHRYDRGWRSRCRASYPAFDYGTGTYLGDDGYRHYCVR